MPDRLGIGCGSVGTVAGENPVVSNEMSATNGEPIAPSTKQLLRWSETLAGIARTGLGFTESLYERERFEEVLHVAADIRAAIEGNEHDDMGGVVHEWLDSVGQGIPGYVTPKVAVGAVVGNDKGEILLVQRSDSGVWLYPTGWADVGYSAPEVVVKEVKEETGIEVEVVKLIAVLDGMRAGMGRIPFYSLVFLCQQTGGELQAHPLECADVGWFARDALPFPMAGVELWGDHVFGAIQGDDVGVFYHPRRSPVWRGDPESL
jgi:ADP-ribose pyrophosphatase YjhB (NUDIX family)